MNLIVPDSSSIRYLDRVADTHFSCHGGDWGISGDDNTNDGPWLSPITRSLFRCMQMKHGQKQCIKAPPHPDQTW